MSETLEIGQLFNPTNTSMDPVSSFFPAGLALMTPDINPTTSVSTIVSQIMYFELALDEYIYQFGDCSKLANDWKDSPMGKSGITFSQVSERLRYLRQCMNPWRMFMSKDWHETIAFCKMLLYITHVDARFGFNTDKGSPKAGGYLFTADEFANLRIPLGQEFSGWLLVFNEQKQKCDKLVKDLQAFHDTHLQSVYSKKDALELQLVELRTNNSSLWEEIGQQKQKKAVISELLKESIRTSRLYLDLTYQIVSESVPTGGEVWMNIKMFNSMVEQREKLAQSLDRIQLEYEEKEQKFNLFY